MFSSERLHSNQEMSHNTGSTGVMSTVMEWLHATRVIKLFVSIYKRIHHKTAVNIFSLLIPEDTVTSDST